MKKSVFVLLLVCGLFLSVPAQGEITITPANVQLPTAAGEDLSFDLAISDPCGVSALAFQATIDVLGPGTLTFDQTSSMALETETNYWLFGNSGGIGADDNLDGTYTFADDSFNSIAEALATSDLMSRYVFEWDGTPGDYIFTLDFNPSVSFVMDELFSINAFLFDPGSFPGDSDSFTLTLVPEPATLMLLGLGGTILLRKRRA